MANPNYNVDYNDERFAQVETQKQAALSEVENTYDNMINESDNYYQAQIDATKQWGQQQQQLQQDRTDFTVEQIEQQKEQAQKDYTKEQSAAYVDYQKQSNKFGAEAEQMASSGLANTGFSESSQVSMYNAYQNRVASAKESMSRATLNYDNAIKDARLQNDSLLAEIAYNTLQQELSLSLEGFQYENALITEQLAQKQATEDRYYNRYQDVLAQINQEHAMAEEVRQYNESLALQREQLTEEKRQYEQNYTLQIKQFEESIRQFDLEMERLKKKDAEEYALEIQQLELQKQKLAAEQEAAKQEYEIQKKAYEEALIKTESGSSRYVPLTSQLSSDSAVFNSSKNTKKQSTSAGNVGSVSNNGLLSLLPRTLYNGSVPTVSTASTRNNTATNTTNLANTKLGLFMNTTGAGAKQKAEMEANVLAALNQKNNGSSTMLADSLKRLTLGGL